MVRRSLHGLASLHLLGTVALSPIPLARAAEEHTTGSCSAGSCEEEGGLSLLQKGLVMTQKLALSDKGAVEGRSGATAASDDWDVVQARSGSEAGGTAAGAFQAAQRESRQAGRRVHHVTGHKHNRSRRAFPPGWFGGFSEGESTYNEDAIDKQEGYPEAGVEEGYFDPSTQPGLLAHTSGTNGGFPPEWFEETKSGGPKEAWQTYYPSVKGLASSQAGTPWRKSSSGGWTQRYTPSAVTGSAAQSQRKGATWFDTSVGQYDSYGRPPLPDDKSGRTYIEWQERTRSVNLTCATPGCVANSTLTIFDEKTERAKNCRLSVKLVPTDFDDQFSRENLEWVIVNGEEVNSKCDPMVSACNSSQQNVLYPCLDAYELDSKGKALASGTLKVDGKITKFVDECPTPSGNLLEAVVSATCYVAGKASPPKTTPLPPLAPPTVKHNLTDHGSCKLQCAKVNCTASCPVLLEPTELQGKTCRLGVKVMQTDFDEEEGSIEQVEWIQVEGAKVASGIKPGKNPCVEAALHPPGLTQAQMVFSALKDQNVTQAAQDGKVDVSAKITEMVDDCGSNGQLLDAIAFVNCTE